MPNDQYEFSEDQLIAAEKILLQREEEREEEHANRLYSQLDEELVSILKTSFRLRGDPDDWISVHVLSEVCYQSRLSLKDFRHRYPYNITALKYLSVVCFWIIKLKPLNVEGFRDENGRKMGVPNINERVAVNWLLMNVCALAKSKQINEITDGLDRFDDLLVESVKFHKNESIYDEDEPKRSRDLPLDYSAETKSHETAYYMRFKKMTAINIYESLIHLLIPIKAIVGNGDSSEAS